MAWRQTKPTAPTKNMVSTSCRRFLSRLVTQSLIYETVRPAARMALPRVHLEMSKTKTELQHDDWSEIIGVNWGCMASCTPETPRNGACPHDAHLVCFSKKLVTTCPSWILSWILSWQCIKWSQDVPSIQQQPSKISRKSLAGGIPAAARPACNSSLEISPSWDEGFQHQGFHGFSRRFRTYVNIK